LRWALPITLLIKRLNIMEQAQNIQATQSLPVETTSIPSPLVVSTELEKLGEKLGDYHFYDPLNPPVEIAGTRIVKCIYQKDKEGNKPKESAYVRIPCKHVTEEIIVNQITELSSYVLSYLQTVEDKMIKADHKKGSMRVYTEFLTLEKITEYIEETEQSARLSKEKIELWFDECLAESLMIRCMEKLGNDASENDILPIIEAYKNKFSLLASPKAFIEKDDCIAMIDKIADLEDILSKRFVVRLEKMQEKNKTLLTDLGI